MLAREAAQGSAETSILTLRPTVCPAQMSNKRSNSFRQAILQGNRRLCSKALLEEKGLNLSQRLIRHVAYETLPREIDRKWYYDSYTCCPPPWFMITVTLLEARTWMGDVGGGKGAAQPWPEEGGREGEQEALGDPWQGEGGIFSQWLRIHCHLPARPHDSACKCGSNPWTTRTSQRLLPSKPPHSKSPIFPPLP